MELYTVNKNITIINDTFYNLLKYNKVLELLQNYKVAAIITDLPYGTIKNSNWDYDINLVNMWKWVRTFAKEYNSDLVFTTTASQPFTSKLIVSNIEQYAHTWVWNKKLAGNGMLAKKQPLKIHEDVITFYMGKVIYYPQMRTGKPRKKMVKVDNSKGTGTYNQDVTVKEYYNDQYYPQSIIEFSSAHLRGKKRIHLAQKPIALYEYLIETYSQENEIILDICMGSGTTCLASNNTNRKCIGIEVNKDVYETSKHYLNKFISKEN